MSDWQVWPNRQTYHRIDTPDPTPSDDPAYIKARLLGLHRRLEELSNVTFDRNVFKQTLAHMAIYLEKL